MHGHLAIMEGQSIRLRRRQHLRPPRTLVGVAICLLLFGAVVSQEAARKITVQVQPEYPELARRTNLEGVAKVLVVISPSGEVKRVAELGGHPVLVEALTKAVKQWKFEQSGKETTQEVRFEFRKSG